MTAPQLSGHSIRRLETCHPDLQAIIRVVILHQDLTVISGVRELAEQLEKMRQGRTRTLDSKHLKQADGWAHAVDIAPFPIDWHDRDRFVHLAGYVQAVADRLYSEGTITHRIRWGGDWDGDGITTDTRLWDPGHFELAAGSQAGGPK